MQRLLGDSVVDESILRNIFLLRLPISIRTSLTVMQDKSLSQLAQIADTLVQMSPLSIAALTHILNKQPFCEQWCGNYFRTGGQNRERQSRESEIKFFAEIGVFYCPKNKRSLKKKGLRSGLGVIFCPKNKCSKK